MAILPPQHHVLAADVGGTKVNIATLRTVPGALGTELEIIRQERYPSGDYPSLNAIIREFLSARDEKVVCAGFGVPGPPKNRRVKPTNLTWGVDADDIEKEFRIPHVELLNDLGANAYGIAELKPSDFATIQEGDPNAEGNRCVVSPGTGLGEAGLYWNGKKHLVWSCEGGHTDFAPRNEIEEALLHYLRRQFAHVSYERVVSGMGIENIYNFLRETGRGAERPDVAEAMQTEDIGAVISRYADADVPCPMCVKTLEIFIGCLGAEAGNMALKAMATGGVYLGGGIPVKLLKRLKSVNFTHAFTDKGRLTSLMEAMPVKVILNDQTALLGAARAAVDAIF